MGSSTKSSEKWLRGLRSGPLWEECDREAQKGLGPDVDLRCGVKKEPAATALSRGAPLAHRQETAKGLAQRGRIALVLRGEVRCRGEAAPKASRWRGAARPW